METDCYCRVRMKSKQQFELTVQMISYAPDSPVFTDEVDEPLLETFNALEYIPVSEALSVDKDKLVLSIHWFLPDAQDAIDAVNSLINAGVRSMSTLIFVDGQFCASYVRDKEGTRRLKKWNDKPLRRIPDSTDIPALLEEISGSLNES